jgi:hypothetical protein
LREAILLGKEETLRRCDSLDFAIDLGTKQKHESGEIEPRQQYDDGSQTPIGDSVIVEEMHIGA